MIPIHIDSAWKGTSDCRTCGIRENGMVISWLEMTTTFILVCVGWVIFRAKNLPDAGYILTHFWQNWDFGAIRTENFLLRQLPVAVLSIVVLELVQYGMRRGSLSGLVSLWPAAARCSSTSACWCARRWRRWSA